MEANEVSDELFNFILKNIKLTQNIQELPETATEEEKAEYENKINLIKYFINKVCMEIKIRTNRNAFPDGLKYVAIDMINDLYYSYNTDTNTDNNQTIQSMSENGRSVNFGISDVLATKLNLLLQRKLNSYDTLINRYRLMYKTKDVKKDEQD